MSSEAPAGPLREPRRRSGGSRALVFLLLSLSLLAACAGPGAGAREALRRGDTALSLDDPEEALRAYREVLAADPRNPGALLGLARAYVATGDAEAALEIFAGLELAAPEVFGAGRDAYQQALDAAASSRAERGDAAGGLRFLRRLAELDPARAGLAERLRIAIVAEGERLLLEGRPSAAEGLFQEVLRAAPGQIEATLGLARSLLERGSVDEAIRVLSDASVRHPGDDRIEALMDRAIEIRYPSSPAKLSL